MKSKYPFADMHSHMLYNVDDGSRSIEESLSMLEIAAEENITHAILTPHYIPGHTENPPERLVRHFNELKARAEAASIPVEIALGTELFYFEGAEKRVKDGSVPTLAGSNRVLLEFFTSSPVDRIRDAILALRSEGYVPVIAHIERYLKLVSHHDEVRYLREIGAEIQVNIGAATGNLGKEVKSFIAWLLSNRYVDYVATDAHDTVKRAPKVQKGLAYLYRKFDREYIQQITYDNICRLIRWQTE